MIEICKHTNTSLFTNINDVEILSCNVCSLVFSTKNTSTPPEETYKNYYKQESGSRFGIGIEYIVRIFRFNRALKIYTKYPKAEKILDIGSGRGWTLYYLKKNFGFKTTVGTQTSYNAYKFSKEKLGLDIYNTDLLETDIKEKFDIITLWHVFEHLNSPEGYLIRISELLKKDGLLIIEVPNLNAWSRIITGRHWLAWDIRHHITFFTPDSLTTLLNKHGFKITKIRTFSIEYSTFTSTQSLVNHITNTNDVLFEWLQDKRPNHNIFLHIFLFVILFPICFVINLALFFSNSGEVINITAKKK